jgi:hypothetical protein
MAICQQRPSIMQAMIVSDAIDTLPYGLTRGLAGVVAEVVSFTAGRTSCQHAASNLPTVSQQMGMAGPPVRHLEAHSLPAPSLPVAGRSQGTLAPHFGAPHAGRSASHAPPRRREVGIEHRGGDIGMTQRFLHQADIGGGSVEVCGERVPRFRVCPRAVCTAAHQAQRHRASDLL